MSYRNAGWARSALSRHIATLIRSRSYLHIAVLDCYIFIASLMHVEFDVLYCRFQSLWLSRMIITASTNREYNVRMQIKLKLYCRCPSNRLKVFNVLSWVNNIDSAGRQTSRARIFWVLVFLSHGLSLQPTIWPIDRRWTVVRSH